MIKTVSKSKTFDPLQPPSGSSWVHSLQDFSRRAGLISFSILISSPVRDFSWRRYPKLTNILAADGLIKFCWPRDRWKAGRVCAKHQWNRESKIGSKIALWSEDKIETKFDKSKQTVKQNLAVVVIGKFKKLGVWAAFGSLNPCALRQIRSSSL